MSQAVRMETCDGIGSGKHDMTVGSEDTGTLHIFATQLSQR